MRVGLLTADVPHRKTEEVVHGLLAKGIAAITIFTVPFVERKSRAPLFCHRPDPFKAAHASELAALFPRVSYHALGGMDDFPADAVDVVLMTGGVLVPDAVLSRSSVIFLNVHAGLIPDVRGLDAFKWAILDDRPLGVTLHEIDARVDMGRILMCRPTPIMADDSLASCAARHYRAEVQLLIDSIDYLDAPGDPAEAMGEIRPASKRMKREDEMHLEAAFERYKSQHAAQDMVDPR